MHVSSQCPNEINLLGGSVRVIERNHPIQQRVEESNCNILCLKKVYTLLKLGQSASAEANSPMLWNSTNLVNARDRFPFLPRYSIDTHQRIFKNRGNAKSKS